MAKVVVALPRLDFNAVELSDSFVRTGKRMGVHVRAIKTAAEATKIGASRQGIRKLPLVTANKRRNGIGIETPKTLIFGPIDSNRGGISTSSQNQRPTRTALSASGTTFLVRRRR